MTVQTTANLTNSIRTRYQNKYVEGAEQVRLYDQFSTPVQPKGDPIDGVSTVQAPFLSEVAIATAAISQTDDITPVTLRDATATVTGTSRGNALQFSEQLDIRAFTNYTQQAYQAVGRNAMLSVEWLAIQEILNGDLVYRATTRSSLDAGTTSHNLSRSALFNIQSRLQTLGCPTIPKDRNGGAGGAWMALGHIDSMYDLTLDSEILLISEYQDKSYLLNGEIGQLGHFRLLGDARAKVFGAAGAAHASVVATTLSAAANALAKTITVASSTNIGNAGRFLTIGTAETAETFYEANERVQVVSTTGTTIRIVGEGPNGGLRWDHASGAAVSNADTVYPWVFGSPYSLAKMYRPQVDGPGNTKVAQGPFGWVGEPETTGLLHQFKHIGWKFYGGYGIWVQPWLYRGEFSSRLDNVST